MQARMLNPTSGKSGYGLSSPPRRYLNDPTKKEIRFYNQNYLPYGVFSNFSDHAVSMDGKEWKTSEHYFQAMKFAGKPYEETIRQASTPGKAKTLGSTRIVPMRTDWDEVKDQVMYDVILAKFTQHDALKTILLGTGDAILVEHTYNDSYWGGFFFQYKRCAPED